MKHTRETCGQRLYGPPALCECGPFARQVAQNIVDTLLAAVVKFGGRIEGRGPDKELTFPLIVKRDSDETEEPRDRMIAWVEKRLEQFHALTAPTTPRRSEP